MPKSSCTKLYLVQVKSTGLDDDTWTPSEAERRSAIRHSVDKAAKQLDRNRDTLHFIMPDLGLEEQVTLVVALPFLSRQRLEQVCSCT